MNYKDTNNLLQKTWILPAMQVHLLFENIAIGFAMILDNKGRKWWWNIALCEHQYSGFVIYY